jgi:uncharacterized membrane protein
MDNYILRAVLVLFGLLLTFVGILAPISPQEYRKRKRVWLFVIGIGLLMVFISIIYPVLVPEPASAETTRESATAFLRSY